MGTFFDILGYLKTVRNFGKSLVASRRHEILLETNNKVSHMIENLSLSIAV